MSEKTYKTIELPNSQTDLVFERMMKNFKKQVEKDGIIEEVKSRRYFHKPSEIKRLRQKQIKKY